MNQLGDGQNTRQRGSALILAIMMMMALGLLGLNTVNQHLNGALALTRSEKNYLLSWELAISSLNWGLSNRWSYQHDPQWQCVESTTYSELLLPLSHVSSAGVLQSLLSSSSFRSCVKPGEAEGQYVLRGEGRFNADALPVYVYQLATFQSEASIGGYFKAIPNTWLDFCPFKEENNCHE